MPICQNCGERFPVRTIHNGREVTLHHRKYCLNCNPIGERKFWGGKKTLRAKLGTEAYDENGKRVRQYKDFVCDECGKTRREKTRNRLCYTCKTKKIRNERKEKAVQFLGGKCQICGYDKCSQAMTFHHRDPEKKEFTLSTSWEKSWEVVCKEVEKCVLLCCRCHAEVHAGVTDLGPMAELADAKKLASINWAKTVKAETANTVVIEQITKGCSTP